MVYGVIKSNNKTNAAAAIDKLFADGAYDSNDIFEILVENGIQPCIKVRKNSRIRWKKGNPLRNLSVLAQRNNLQGWKDGVNYGQRWIVETVFSCLKRMFGEYVYSIKLKNMIQEMMLKASLYNRTISV